MNESRAFGADSRLTRGPAPALAQSAFTDELTAAPYVAPWLGVADLAHVAMLARAGVVERRTAARLLRGLLALEQEQSSVHLDPAVGDLYNNRDVFLRDRLGADAGFIHAGRPRREATTIAWQLACRERIVLVGAALARFVDVLIARAVEHRATVMPDYTYMQAAQPTTLGHYLLGFVYPMLRDDQRLVSAFALVNRSPAGSGSVNGSRFDFDREWVAQLLSFDAVVTHTRDAMWAPDMATEQLGALVTICTNLDRLVEDTQIWTSEEFGYVDLDDGHSRASVIMPNKKNPYSLAWMRGRARFLIGRWVSVVSTFMTPTGQPDNRITSYVEVPAALEDVQRCLDLAADVFRCATFDVAGMEAAATRGYLYASDLCDLLVEGTGIDNRSAHRIVGLAVRDRIARGGGPIEVLDIARAADALEIELAAVDADELDLVKQPERLIALRRSVGGAAAEPMQQMFDEVRARAAESHARWRDHWAIRFRAVFTENIRTEIRKLDQ